MNPGVLQHHCQLGGRRLEAAQSPLRTPGPGEDANQQEFVTVFSATRVRRLFTVHGAHTSAEQMRNSATVPPNVTTTQQPRIETPKNQNKNLTHQL